MKYILLFACILSALNISAQDKKKNDGKPPVYNYVLDDPMNQVYNQYNEKNRTFIYVPGFYFFKARVVNDTTYTFECYDANNSIISPNKIQDITKVRSISEFGSYTDHAHTHKDVVRKYSRIDDKMWMCIDYVTKKHTQLKEDRTYVVRTDTLSGKDARSGDELDTIFCYYKVDKKKK